VMFASAALAAASAACAWWLIEDRPRTDDSKGPAP